MNVISSKPIPLARVRELLEERKESSELSYEQERAFEHAKKFATESSKETEALIAELLKNKKLNEETAVIIANVKPKKAETLKAILLKDRIDLTDEEIEEILKKVR